MYISKTIRDRGKVQIAKMFSMSRSTKKVPQLKMSDNCVKIAHLGITTSVNKT
jgi:hypothetical protein